ncbi:MAG: aldo/keto reductase [Bifidobacterium castoris]|nr:aldo/keto reductase [Bifidobacterium castoris]
MQYTTLGPSDLEVSRICLGCMSFGDPNDGQHSWTLDEDASRAIVRQALDSGINFFDTAIVYQHGASEAYLGRALASMASRDSVVVATKFLPRTDEEIAHGVSGQQHVRDNLDASLRHLGMDHVDLYIYHMWDWRTPIEAIMEGLADAVASGKTRYIGAANIAAWQLEKANAIAREHGWPQFISVQNHMNLLFREDEREMLPCASEEGTALTPYSALASGRLSRQPGETSRRLREDAFAQGKYNAAAAMDADIIDEVMRIADEHGVTMTTVALAWLLTKATAPIIGATKPHHLDGAVAAVDFELSDDDIAALERPYRPHPIVGVMAQNTKENAAIAKSWGK